MLTLFCVVLLLLCSHSPRWSHLPFLLCLRRIKIESERTGGGGHCQDYDMIWCACWPILHSPWTLSSFAGLAWPGKCFILMAFLECKLPQVAQCVLLCPYKGINYVYILCVYCIYISVWPGDLERGPCLRLRLHSLWIFVFCIDFLSCRCGSNLFRILL